MQESPVGSLALSHALSLALSHALSLVVSLVVSLSLARSLVVSLEATQTHHPQSPFLRRETHHRRLCRRCS